MEQRTDDGLLAGGGHGTEAPVHRVLVEPCHGLDERPAGGYGTLGRFGQVVAGPVVDAVGGAERDDDLAAAVADIAAAARDADGDALGHAPQLARIGGQIGGDDRDDAALVLVLAVRVRAAGVDHAPVGGRCGAFRFGEAAADRFAVEAQAFARTEVRERQHADHVVAAVHAHHARGRPDAALEPEAGHARAGAHVAFVEVLAGRGDRLQAVRRRDGAGADRVDGPVVAFHDHRVHRAGVDADGGMAVERMVHERVEAGAAGQRVGHEDRRFEAAELLDLHESHRLAEAVGHVRGGGQLAREAVAGRHDGGHAGADRRRGAVGRTQRDVADPHAGHVGDEVALPRAAVVQVMVPYGIRSHGGPW